MNCDRIARLYRWAEYLTFGRALEKRRFEYLDRAAMASHVLILGDGDGRFAAKLLTRNPSIVVDSVDLSVKMLRLAAARVSEAAPYATVSFVHGDAMRVGLSHGYDLIVSHFFLDCFTNAELSRLIPRIARAALGAPWIVSEFQITGRHLQRVLSTFIVGALYLGFRLATGLRTNRLPDFNAALHAAGYRLSKATNGGCGLLVSQVWEPR